MSCSLLKKSRAIWYFANERERIRIKKDGGFPRPWSVDPVLSTYKFCNVFRRDDRVSRWLIKNWYEPNVGHPNLWFASVIARQINWPDTLEKIGFPHVWDPSKVHKIMSELRESGVKLFTGAYILPTPGKGVLKHDYTVFTILDGVWKDRADLKPRKGETLESAHTRFKRYPGFGDFLAMEVILDWLETPILATASDRLSFAAAGPGAIRGLNRVFERDLDTRISFDQCLKEMRQLAEIANSVESPLGPHITRPLDLADIEGLLCETDKYLRIVHDGRSREVYTPFSY